MRDFFQTKLNEYEESQARRLFDEIANSAKHNEQLLKAEETKRFNQSVIGGRT